MSVLASDGTGVIERPSSTEGDTFPSPSVAVRALPIDAVTTHYGAWLRWRREGITSSDIMAILGLLPYRSAYEVWLDKTGRLPLKVDTHLLERGRRLEPACAQWLADRCRLTLLRTGSWANLARPWMRANPDRFVVGQRAGVELKVVDADWTGLWADGPADYAHGQAQWCMAATGATHWYVGALLLGRHDFVVYRVERDEFVIERMALFAWQWQARYIRDGDEPPVDASEATESALKAAYPRIGRAEVEVPGLVALADRRKAAKARIKAAETELRGIENEIRAALGDAEAGIEDGRTVLTYKQFTKTVVDVDVVKAEYPEALVAVPYRQLRDVRK